MPKTTRPTRKFSLFQLDGLREPDVLARGGAMLSESDREPLYKMELLRMFRERIRLVAFVGVLLLPLFTAFYFLVAPETAGAVARWNVLLMAALVVMGSTTPALRRLSWARLHSLIGYAVFCLGVAVVIATVRQTSSPGSQSTAALQFTVLASYIHILLTLLLLPYSLWETVVVLGVIASSVLWGMYWSSPWQLASTDYAQLFVLVTTGVLILAISHVQNVLRRRAFDSAFDLARQAALMHAESSTDTLTGGYNRRYVETLLTAELTRSARFGHPLSLIMFDLDNFKPVNDSLGHSAGDEVLKEIHATAQETLREVDVLGRFGGDEFLILLPETDGDAARTLAQRLRNATNLALRDRFGPHSRQARVTLSMGILTLYGQPCTLAAALERVDELLYEAKRGGKNQVAASQRRRSI